MSLPISQLLLDWRKASLEIEALVLKLPKIIGVESIRVIRMNFDLQGYDHGQGVDNWPKRKDSTNKAYDKRTNVKGSVFNSASPILSQTHALKRAIKAYPEGKSTVLIGVDLGLVPYAKIHNEGGQGKAFGKYAFKMPQRQYMPLPDQGPNPKIYKAVHKKIIYERDRILKKFNL